MNAKQQNRQSLRSLMTALLGILVSVFSTPSLAGASPEILFSDSFELPPDPAILATPLKESVPYDIATDTAFLYTPPNAIQFGVDPNDIDPVRVAVLRGMVMDSAGAPLGGVKISVLDHPEFGFTLSRNDGWFDMAVNGGQPLTLVYERDGVLPAQRRLHVPYRDFVIAPDVALMRLSSRVDTVGLTPGAELQMARGEMVVDDDGQRQATILFPEGTSAEMVMPDGSTAPLTTLNVRATEYTVGEMGPMAMPADLPAFTEYTYAVELSVDEAVAAGARSVQFDQPLPVYLENFLDLPVGSVVPSGFYDQEQARWIPSPDGIVIQVTGESSGMAQVDLDGDTVAESESDLLGFGFSGPELQQLSTLYQAGDTLWRVPVSHFTPYDFNYPPPPPEPEDDPSPVVLVKQDREREKAAIAKDVDDRLDCDRANSSHIACQLQAMGESVPITGTAFSLNYRSDRSAGMIRRRTLDIDLVRRLPQNRPLLEVFVEIQIAGRLFKESFDNPQPGLSYQFTWDGLDAYGRPVFGGATANITVGYLTEIAYCIRPYVLLGLNQRSFDQLCQLGTSVIEQRFVRRTAFPRRQSVQLSGPVRDIAGGWTLDVHHHYDSEDQVLYLGNGSRISAPNVENTITRFIGGGESFEDGIPADQADLGNPQPGFLSGNVDVAAAGDGSVFLAVTSNNRIRRVMPDGMITTVAGQLGLRDFSPDTTPADVALLSSPMHLALGPDDSLYFVEAGRDSRGFETPVVRKIGLDGLLKTIAGGGEVAAEADFAGSLAIELKLPQVKGVAVAPDGTVFVALNFGLGGNSLMKIGADGRVSLLPPVGGAIGVTLGPNGQVLTSGFCGRLSGAIAEPLALDRQSCYDATGLAGIFQVLQDGQLVSANFQAVRLFPELQTAAVSERDEFQGVTYIGRQLPAGTLIIGNDDGSRGCQDPAEFGGPAFGACLGPATSIRQIAQAADGDLLLNIADGIDGSVIARVSSPFSGFTGDQFLVPNPDTQAVYRFDAQGRHLETINGVTGATQFQFDYDDAGRLVLVRDAFGNETTIERDGGGRPMAIVAPLGQRTELELNGSRLIRRIANPAGDAYEFSYSPAGLMTGITDPIGNASSYEYAGDGALIAATAADGYQQTLTRTSIERGFEVLRSTAGGSSSTYQVFYDEDNNLHYVNTDEAGAQTFFTQSPELTTTTRRPSGQIEVEGLLADPIYAVQDPGAEVFMLRTPNGRSLTVTTQRDVLLSDPDDPFSIMSVTQTREVGTRTTTSVFDASTGTITTTSPTGRVSSRTLSPEGLVLSGAAGAGLEPVVFEYNSRGQPSRRSQGAESIEYFYDSLGRLAAERNGLGHERSYTYDAADRLKSVTSPSGRVYTYDHSPRGDVSEVTMPNGSTHSLDSTVFFGPASYTAPGAQALTAVYDQDRRRTGLVLPDGSTQSFGFDEQNRSNSVTYPEAQVDFTYVGLTQRFDSLSRTALPNGTPRIIQYSYDGELVTSVAFDNDLVTYRFDPDLRLAGIQLNAEPEWTYVHDDDDLVAGYGPFTISRDGPAGRPGTFSDGTLTIAYTFDSRGRLTGRAYSVNGNAAYDLALSFEAGTERIAQRTETISSVAATFGYSYSLDGELIGVSINGASAHAYGYDVNGNRTSADGETAAYDSQDRLLTRAGVGYVFDANGVLEQRGNDSFSYSARGELLSVALEGGEQASYDYDAMARRVSRTDASGSLTYIYGDPGNPFLVMATRAPDGSLTRYYYDESDVLVALDRGSERFYVAADQLGSPVLVVNAAGVIIKQLEYGPFGTLVSDSNPAFGLPIGFAGGIHDPVSGLVRFGLRDYEPASGRWTARDPLLFDAGQPNLYAYVNSNPIGYRDPTGLFCVGFEVYEGYGAGGKFCFKDGKWSVCGETGLAVGAGFSLDLQGAAASRADADYVSANADLSCGPVGVGANAKIDDCGVFKACVKGSTSTKILNFLGLGATSQVCQNFLTGQTETSNSLGTTADLADVAIENGPGTGRLTQEIQAGKIKCKGSLGIKGGFCIGSNTF